MFVLLFLTKLYKKLVDSAYFAKAKLWNDKPKMSHTTTPCIGGDDNI